MNAAERLARIEEQSKRIEEKLSRVLGVLFPEEDDDGMNFVRSLEGKTTDEIRAANSRRTKEMRAKKAKEAKA